MSAAAKTYTDAADNLTYYVFDLIVEAQNALISELFGRKVPRRVPGDPDVLVVTTDAADYARLHRHFTIESAHGQASQRAIEAVQMAVEARRGNGS